MRLKLIRAASMADAMAQLRRELGPDALILSTRLVADGVELTAALDQPDEPGPSFEAEAAVAVLDAAYHSVPAGLAARLAGPDLAACLAASLSFGSLPIGGPVPLLVAGQPGAGKTLTVARLATRMVLAGQRPLVITADNRRAGGAEELAAYTRLLGITLLAAGTPSSLGRALSQSADAGEPTPILIDTAGLNPFDAAELDGLADLIDAAGACPVLVQQAGAHPDEAAEQAAAMARLGIVHLLPTRLDCARRLGSVLAAADTGLTLTEAGIGTGAADGLVQITPAFLAERLLRAQPPLASPVSAPPTPALASAPHMPESPEAPRLRAPVFPSARSVAAHAWDMHPHG